MWSYSRWETPKTAVSHLRETHLRWRVQEKNADQGQRPQFIFMFNFSWLPHLYIEGLDSVSLNLRVRKDLRDQLIQHFLDTMVVKSFAWTFSEMRRHSLSLNVITGWRAQNWESRDLSPGSIKQLTIYPGIESFTLLSFRLLLCKERRDGLNHNAAFVKFQWHQSPNIRRIFLSFFPPASSLLRTMSENIITVSLCHRP